MSSCTQSLGSTFINVDGARYGSMSYELGDGSAAGEAKRSNISNTTYVPVNAGSYTDSLEVDSSTSSSGSTWVWRGGINVLFVPYGGDGSTP